MMAYYSIYGRIYRSKRKAWNWHCVVRHYTCQYPSGPVRRIVEQCLPIDTGIAHRAAYRAQRRGHSPNQRRRQKRRAFVQQIRAAA